MNPNKFVFKSMSRFFWSAGIVASFLFVLTVMFTSGNNQPKSSSLSAPSAMNGITSRLEKSLFNLSVKPTRNISSTENTTPVCLKNRLFAPDDLQKEIEQFEKNYVVPNGVTLLKKWDKVDISGFKQPEIAYLSRFGDWIKLSYGDYVGCTNLPCIINRSVKMSDVSPYGQYLYLFFLKTGYVISTSRSSPKYSWDEDGNYVSGGVYFRTAPFSLEEAGAFWRLSHVLPDGMKYMTNQLMALHRMPEGENVYGHGADVCGVATSTGHIISTHQCIMGPYYGSSWNMKLYNMHFWNHYMHEIAHRYDDNNGSLSEKKPWTDFSGWIWQAGTLVGGVKTKDKWISNPALEGFVTDYASTLPWEDFAESVETFRITLKEYFSDDTLQNVILPQKWKYISDTVFSGRNFTPSGILSTYQDIVSATVSKKIDEVIEECFINPTTDDVNKCVSSQRDQMISLGILDLRANEIDACDLLDEKVGTEIRENQLRKLINKNLESIISERIAAREADAEILKLVGQLRDKLESVADPREAYILCRESANEKECYLASLSKTFDDIVQSIEGISPEWLATEKRNWIALNAFDDIRAKTIAFYSTVFSSIDGMVENGAKELWKGCEVQELADGTTILLKPFDGGTNYIDGGFLHCINTGYALFTDDVISKYLRRFGFTLTGVPHRELIEKQIIRPSVKILFSSYIDQESASEKTALSTLQTTIAAAGETAINANNDWIVIPWNKDQSLVNCLEIGAVPAREALAQTENSVQWKYHTKEAWIKDIVAGFCDQQIAPKANAAAAEKLKLDSTDSSIRKKIRSVLTNSNDWIIKPWNKVESQIKCLEKASKEFRTQLDSGIYPKLTYYPMEELLKGIPEAVCEAVIVESDSAALLEKVKVDKNITLIDQKMRKGLTSESTWLVNPWNSETAKTKCLTAANTLLKTAITSYATTSFRYYDIRSECTPLPEVACREKVEASNISAIAESNKMNNVTKPDFSARMESYLIKYKSSWYVATSGVINVAQSESKCVAKGKLNIDYHMKLLSSGNKIAWKYNPYTQTTQEWVAEICKKIVNP